jgi:hypothetical protein
MDTNFRYVRVTPHWPGSTAFLPSSTPDARCATFSARSSRGRSSRTPPRARDG